VQGRLKSFANTCISAMQIAGVLFVTRRCRFSSGGRAHHS
jgi:hypothetical protein